MYPGKHRRRTLKRHSRSRKTVGGFSVLTPFFQAFSAFKKWRTSRSKKNGHPAHHPVHHFKPIKPKSKKVKEEMGRMTKIITETPEYQSVLTHEENKIEKNKMEKKKNFNRAVAVNRNRNISEPVVTLSGLVDETFKETSENNSKRLGVRLKNPINPPNNNGIKNGNNPNRASPKKETQSK